MTRKSRLIVIVVVIALAIVAVLLATRKPAVPPAPVNAPAGADVGAQAGDQAAGRASLAVEAVVPAQATWPVALVANGALAAWQEATISAETGGLRIVALHADVGSRVKRGQLLAELNSQTVKADVRKAQAAVTAAQARLREAQANVKRGQAVRESGSLSGQQIEQYEIAQQTAAAELESAQADLASVRIRLDQSRIVAVDDGVISARTATLGAVVASGAELFTLVRDERIEWRAEVDAPQMALLKPGQQASIGLSDGVQVKGQVRQLAPTLDAKTRIGLVYVDLPRDARLRAGTYVRGQIALGEQAAMVLPSTAITLRDGRSYVFEIDRQKQAVIQREIETGRHRGEHVEIVRGIGADTPVVKSGGAFLNDGDIVRIEQAGKVAKAERAEQAGHGEPGASKPTAKEAP